MDPQLPPSTLSAASDESTHPLETIGASEYGYQEIENAYANMEDNQIMQQQQQQQPTFEEIVGDPDQQQQPQPQAVTEDTSGVETASEQQQQPMADVHEQSAAVETVVETPEEQKSDEQKQDEFLNSLSTQELKSICKSVMNLSPNTLRWWLKFASLCAEGSVPPLNPEYIASFFRMASLFKETEMQRLVRIMQSMTDEQVEMLSKLSERHIQALSQISMEQIEKLAAQPAVKTTNLAHAAMSLSLEPAASERSYPPLSVDEVGGLVCNAQGVFEKAGSWDITSLYWNPTEPRQLHALSAGRWIFEYTAGSHSRVAMGLKYVSSETKETEVTPPMPRVLRSGETATHYFTLEKHEIVYFQIDEQQQTDKKGGEFTPDTLLIRRIPMGVGFPHKAPAAAKPQEKKETKPIPVSKPAASKPEPQPQQPHQAVGTKPMQPPQPVSLANQEKQLSASNLRAAATATATQASKPLVALPTAAVPAAPATQQQKRTSVIPAPAPAPAAAAPSSVQQPIRPPVVAVASQPQQQQQRNAVSTTAGVPAVATAAAVAAVPASSGRSVPSSPSLRPRVGPVVPAVTRGYPAMPFSAPPPLPLPRK